MNITRNIETYFLTLINTFPALGILGPRQVGKTTLTHQLAKQIDKETIYLDLELNEDLNKLENPEYFFKLHQDKCIIIDEVQRMLPLFPIIRGMIDQHRIPGRFILLGSASPEFLRKSSETLAGRIIYEELTGFTFPEINTNFDQERLWLRGGFPEPFLLENNVLVSTWLKSFIKTYIERDLRNLGLTGDLIRFERFLIMLAHAQGNTFNINNFTKSLGVKRSDIENWWDFIEMSFIGRKLPAYYTNTKKRLVKSPKLYLRDTGILHALLNTNSIENILASPIAGASWESYVIEQIIANGRNNYEYYFYRTQDKAECDLLLTISDVPKMCIEIKLNHQPKSTRSLTSTIQELGTENNYIIIPNSPSDYSLNEKVQVCDLGTFLTKYLKTELT